MSAALIAAIAAWTMPVILAITLHEAAHGYAARIFGDSTAWNLGRVTLNPLKHIDPIGTLLIPGILLLVSLTSGANLPVFGWAKPVPVRFGALRSPKRDMLWVAAAGPASNLLQAIAWAVLISVLSYVYKLEFSSLDEALSSSNFFVRMSAAGIAVNVALMALNLIPIPPLDGGRIAVSLLPMNLAVPLQKVEPYGFFILIALIYTHVLDVFVWPIADAIQKFIFQLAL